MQGRIQDAKLGVAQMHWKNWKKIGGGGGDCINYYEYYNYYSIYLKYDVFQIRFLLQYCISLAPLYSIAIKKSYLEKF